MISKLIARAGLVTLPVTACAPLVGCALAGRGAPWLVLPVGSVAAFVCGNRAARRTEAGRRFGVVVSAPAVAETGVEYAAPPCDTVTVEYAWSDVA